MATEVGSLYYDLNINDKDLKKQLDRADAHVKNFGDRLSQHWESSVNASKKVLMGITALSAGAVAFGVSSVKSYMESEKAQAALANTLKSTNNVSGQTLEGMNKLAAQLQATTGYTDEFVGTAQNMLLTFTNVGKDVFPQATRATLDMARQFGGDAQQNAIRLGKALQDPIAGVGALSKIGVQFSAVQKEQIANFMAAGDIMSAQKVILGEISTQTKGAAEAYGKTFAGQIDILKASFDDLKEGMGQMLVKGLQPLTRWFSEWIKNVNEAGGLLEYFKGIIERNRNTFELVAGAIVGMLIPAVVALGIAFGSFLLTIAPWAALGVGIALAVKAIVKHFGGWHETMKKIKPIIEGVTEGIKILLTGDFKGGFFGLSEDSPVVGALIVIHNMVVAVWDALKMLGELIASSITPTLNALRIVWDMIYPSMAAVFRSVWENLLPALKQLWDAVVKLWNALNPALMEALKIIGMIIGGTLLGIIWLLINALNVTIQVFSWIISVISNVIGWISNLISWYGALWGTVINVIRGIGDWFSKLPGYARDAVNGVIAWVRSIPGAVRGAIGDAYNMLFDIGKWIIWGLKDGMSSVLKSVKDAVGNVANTVKSSIKSLLGIKSPSTVFMEIGRNVTAGFVKGINDSTSLAMRAMAELGNNVIAPTLNVTGSGNNDKEAQQGRGNTIVNVGQINNQQDEAYVMRRINRNSELEGIGISPVL